MTIGTFLKERRKAKGFSQTRLSYNAEVPQKLVSMYETGRVQPSVETLERLAQALDFELPWMAEEQEEGDTGDMRRYVTAGSSHRPHAA